MSDQLANCEECGKEIYPEYALCESCEQRIYGTIDGIPVNEVRHGDRTNGYPLGTIGAETR